MNNLSLRNYIFIILIGYFLWNCGQIKYAQDINKETKNKIVSHKEFFYKLGFNGTVTKLATCNSCALNKYQVILDLNDKMNDSLTLSNTSFQPYYNFSNNKQLYLVVNCNIFKKLKIGSIFIKNKNSDKVVIESKEINYLSSQKDKWLEN